MTDARFRSVLKSQYHAALAMLREAVERCPADEQSNADHKNGYRESSTHSIIDTNSRRYQPDVIGAGVAGIEAPRTVGLRERCYQLAAIVAHRRIGLLPPPRGTRRRSSEGSRHGVSRSPAMIRVGTDRRLKTALRQIGNRIAVHLTSQRLYSISARMPFVIDTVTWDVVILAPATRQATKRRVPNCAGAISVTLVSFG